MKRLLIISLFIAFLVSVSCTQDGIKPYNIEDSAICFANQSSTFSFKGVTEDKLTFTIPLTLVGVVADYDREVTVKVYDTEENTAVEGRDFVIKDAVVRAGELSGEIVIDINNLAEGVTNLNVILEILPNDHFRAGYKKLMTSRILWSEEYTRPSEYNVWWCWYYYICPGYSRALHEFVVQVMGEDIEVAVSRPGHVKDGLVYWAVDKWYATSRLIRQKVAEYDSANPDNPLMHSEDYESYKGPSVAVGSGQKPEKLPTVYETLVIL